VFKRVTNGFIEVSRVQRNSRLRIIISEIFIFQKKIEEEIDHTLRIRLLNNPRTTMVRVLEFLSSTFYGSLCHGPTKCMYHACAASARIRQNAAPFLPVCAAYWLLILILSPCYCRAHCEGWTQKKGSSLGTFKCQERQRDIVKLAGVGPNVTRQQSAAIHRTSRRDRSCPLESALYSVA
jgi:hypothetical protein